MGSSNSSVCRIQSKSRKKAALNVVKQEAVQKERDWSEWIGSHGRKEPYVNLENLIDCSVFAELHEEICLGLLGVDWFYTGGSHKWMKIVPPEFADDAYADYMEVINNFSDEEFMRFIALGSPQLQLDVNNRRHYTFGEDAKIPLSWNQYQYLKYRYGVYFPWKVYYQFIEGEFDWTTKHLHDRDFTEQSKEFFPKTCAYIRSLPFKNVGRCDLMGLEANDHGTIHRDNYERRFDPPIMDFITICPADNKSLFLWHEETKEKLFVPGKAYTFNDMNYHGVEPEKHFRYSIRIDGTFTDEFREKIRQA